VSYKEQKCKFKKTKVVRRKAGPKQAAEKGCFSGETPEKHASGAKARVDSIGLMPGINPRPTARLGFSAACEGRPD
jgi:hypothetical protein